MIEFTNVSKKYANGVIGLHNINIQIEPGEFLFVIGPSGAGKSSFLKMINRQEKSTGGQIMVKGLNVSKLNRFKVPKLRRQIGVVFQDFKLLQKMTVYQYYIQYLKAAWSTASATIELLCQQLLLLLYVLNPLL